MKTTKIFAMFLALCMVLSIGGFASSDMPDTSQGGRATSAPPDNSTKAVDILGTRAAIYFEYADGEYTLTQNLTDDYALETANAVTAPVAGELNVLEGISLYCGAEAWDEENAVGNSGIVINSLTDTETTYLIGGDEDLYEAPDGKMYNSVFVMDVAEDEELASGATETAPGTGIAFNGNRLELKNVYGEASGTGRPTVHIPASTRDKNVSQLSDLVIVDSSFMNHNTRAFLLMGGDVWCLNSSALTNAWGALSFDNTSATMYVVNSDVENMGLGGYAIYDAAGCALEAYGSRIVAGNTAITVCRTATAIIDSLENTSDAAAEPYDGEAELLVPVATEDGRTELIAYDYPIKMHADMSGADSQAVAEIRNTYMSTLIEDIVFADGTTPADYESTSSGISALMADHVNGTIIDIACHNGKVVFDNCELHSRTGVLVHTAYAYDSMASGIYPVDGAEYVGDEIVLRNMSAEGDILHEDYFRKMVLSLENAELTGRVVGGTVTSWNNYWKDVVASMPEDELTEATDDMTAVEATLARCIYNDTYDTIWGVRMSMDAGSVWTVTGDSNLYSFTMADGAVVQAPEGKSLSIYVDCGMSGEEAAYDTSVGTKIDAFEAGVEYSGVVILVEDDAAADGMTTVTLGAEELSALGIETYVEDGQLRISLGGILDALGASLSYDEETETVTITDNTGVMKLLVGYMAG